MGQVVRQLDIAFGVARIIGKPIEADIMRRHGHKDDADRQSHDKNQSPQGNAMPICQLIHDLGFFLRAYFLRKPPARAF
jgi:hypothetical protein